MRREERQARVTALLAQGDYISLEEAARELGEEADSRELVQRLAEGLSKVRVDRCGDEDEDYLAECELGSCLRALKAIGRFDVGYAVFKERVRPSVRELSQSNFKGFC